MTLAERNLAGNRSALDPGESGHSFDECVEEPLDACLVVALSAEVERRGENVGSRVEADVDLGRLVQAAKKQTACAQEEDGERELCNDEEALNPCAAAVVSLSDG